MLINFILMNTIHTTPNPTKNGTKLYVPNKQIAQLIGLFLWCTASFFTNLHAQDKATIANSYYLNGINQFDEGNYQEAITNFEKAANTIETSTPDMHYYLIKSYLAADFEYLKKPNYLKKIKHELLKEYFEKYPHDRNSPMYQEMTILITTIDDKIKQAYSELLSNLSKSWADYLTSKINGLYTSEWAKNIVSGKEKEHLEEFYENYKYMIKYRDSIVSVYNLEAINIDIPEYDGWSVKRTLEAFLGTETGNSWPYTANKTFKNALAENNISNFPVQLDAYQTETSGKGKYYFRTDITNDARINKVFYTAANNINSDKARMASYKYPIEKDKSYLFVVSVETNDITLTYELKNKRHYFFENSNDFGIKNGTTDEYLLKFSHIRKYLADLGYIKKNIEENSLFLHGRDSEVDLKTRSTLNFYYFISNNKQYCNVLYDGNKLATFKGTIPEDISSIYFYNYNYSYQKNKQELNPINVSVQLIDIDSIIKEVRECSAFLWDMTTRSN